MSIVFDAPAKTAFGGTEYMMTELEKKLDKILLNNFYISRCVGTLSVLPKDKIKIFWAHQFPLPNFHNEPVWFTNKKWEGFDKVVFVSNTQKDLFFSFYNMDTNDYNNINVIHNAIDPIDICRKPKDKINLIYISSPDRGLDILYETFCLISKKYSNIFLYVFSSTSELNTSPYKTIKESPFNELYKKLKSHPKIFYSDRVPKKQLVEFLKQSHIFVYPSTWWETFCISLAEAMSAKCICVHPNYGAFHETSGGLTKIYNFTPDKSKHITTLYIHLLQTIENLHIKLDTYDLNFSKQYVDKKYNWDNIIQQWNKFLTELLHNNKLYYD